MRQSAAMVALVAIAVIAMACEHPCRDAGIDSDGRYKATIVDVYDAQSSFTFDPSLGGGAGIAQGSCAQIDGLGPGASLEFQATGTTDDSTRSCLLVSAELTSVPGEIMPGDGSAKTEENVALDYVNRSDGLIHSVQQASIAGCEGGYAVNVYPGMYPPSTVFDTPVPGQIPPAILFRIFVPVSGSSCQTCYDNFVIQFSKE